MKKNVLAILFYAIIALFCLYLETGKINTGYSLLIGIFMNLLLSIFENLEKINKKYEKND